jgi:hypothetical protein
MTRAHRAAVAAAVVGLVIAARGDVRAQGMVQEGGVSSYMCQYSYDRDGYFVHPFHRKNPTYDGKVTFARIKWQGRAGCADEGPGWSHDYPVTEAHFVEIMKTVTSINPFVRKGEAEASTLLSWADKELFHYPVAYLSEPGYWQLMNDAELKGFKTFVQRGGFVIFDDMGWRGEGARHLQNLMAQWNRAFPGAKPIRLTQAHPIFHVFFSIDLNKITPYSDNRGSYGDGTNAEYYGIFQDNDEKKRMLAVINNNQDLGEFMEFSGRGFETGPSNEAYKLTINYFMYALTH